MHSAGSTQFTRTWCGASDGPFAGESVHGTLSGGVSGGLALAGGGDFGADVDDGALVADEFLSAKMRECKRAKIQVRP